MGAVLQILLLAGVLEVFSVLSPFFIQLVVDNALVAEDRNLLTILGVGFLLLALLQVGITAARSWAVLVLGTVLNLQLGQQNNGQMPKSTTVRQPYDLLNKGFGPGANGTLNPAFVGEDVKIRDYVFKVGMNYKFGWGY